MATFKYKVRDKFGKALTGVMDGSSRDSAAKSLESMGYAPVSVEELRKTGPGNMLAIFKKVSLEELNLFTTQLLTLQRAGLPILLGLKAVYEQTNNRHFKSVIQQIMTDIEGGASLSSAFANHPDIFNELYVSMIMAGETAGTLDDMLQRLSQLGEDELLMRSRVKSAVRYPMIVIGTIFTALFVILGFVIPRFAALFSSFKVALPLPTRILLVLSVIFTKFWFLTLIIIAGAVYGFIKFINSGRGRPVWDNFKLKVYVFGRLNLMIIMARFCRVTAILLKSGLPILQILELVKKTAGNSIVEHSIDDIRNSVAEGKGISEPMKVSGLYPPIVTQMVAIGEETGKVDELLMRVAEYYDSRIEYMLKNLTTLIEPILIFFLGGVVLVMSLAIFLPMWNMIQLFRR
jgi:type II secretory pathway component PulF